MSSHAASEYVWALVAGFPRAQREQRLLMILQAHIDDSGSEPDSPLFVLAGFVARAADWAKFSDEWRAALDQPPRLEYFKMKEAHSMRGQFDRRHGWNEAKRDDRLITFTRLIRKYAIARIHGSMWHADFNACVKSLPVPERKFATDHPYWLLFMRLVLTLSVFGHRIGINDPCEFICDEQGGISEEILAWWPTFKKMVADTATPSGSDLPPRIGTHPIFRDDKKFLPLQAADLYAWQLRRVFTRSRVLVTPPSAALVSLVTVPELGWNFSQEEMRRMHDHLLATKAAFVALNPTVPLLAISSDRAGRKRARRSKTKKKTRRLGRERDVSAK